LRSAARATIAILIVLLAPTALAAPATAQAASKAVSATRATARLRISAFRYALAQRHKPYIWGGTGPFGFDCSGLVYAAYRASGMTLPRTTYEMLGSWRLVRIPKSEARRGDLAFFGTGHVELYDWGPWTYGAAHPGSHIGFHRMNAFWHPTMYFRIRL
jgi:cell wall-associated NlpC family hydrolase